MMNDAEIQIQFPKPGTWQEFTLTAVYQDAEGYTRTARYAPNEIPADQAPSMQAVVSALVGLAETVDLTVEAVNPQGGRRVFTSRDYPAFVIMEPAAVEFFKFFTTNQ